MKDIFNNAISSELFFVYALIALVIILIIVIIILDKKESKKEPKSLFDTLNMKIIADSNEQLKSEKLEEVVINPNTDKPNITFDDLAPLKEIEIKDTETTLQETISELKNEPYQETELDKTQAQIRVEEITKALKEAQKEQEQEDKYQKFEEEQEKNAIISYNELKQSFDRLYSENEKIQYLEDDEIPININELYELRDNKQKAKLDDFNTVEVQKDTTSSGFKSSPLISPVYGIQKPPVENNFKSVDHDIENANMFLKNLKELKNNLE